MLELVKIPDQEEYKVYDFLNYKSISFLIAGTGDYYLYGTVYENGKLEEDNSLKINLDASNIELYKLFRKFFELVKKVALKCREHSSYDSDKLYNASLKQIYWITESGNPGPMNLNGYTEMFIKEVEDHFEIIFKNKMLEEINVRKGRYVCIAASGSQSKIMLLPFSIFYQGLSDIPSNMSYEEAEEKIKKC